MTAEACTPQPVMPADQLRWVYETALLARRYEARLIRLCREGFMPPLLHPGAGQEVSQLAALSAMRADDPLLYAHRGVAYMLGRGVSLTEILADMAGREGGTNNGKGGVMHVVDVKRGVYGESGTLGGGFVIAAGVAMALKFQRRPQVVIHFFGDGTSNRGTFHESLNWCALRKLPAVFVCENNGWAVSVPTEQSTSVANISSRATGYGIPGLTVDGSDPEAVFGCVKAAADRARAGDGPTLVEIMNVRLLGHYATDPQDYRENRECVSSGDPLERLRCRLLDSGVLTEAETDELEQRLESEIERAVDTVRNAALLDGDLAFTNVYA